MRLSDVSCHLQKMTAIAQGKLKGCPDTDRKIKQFTNSGLGTDFGSNSFYVMNSTQSQQKRFNLISTIS